MLRWMVLLVGLVLALVGVQLLGNLADAAWSNGPLKQAIVPYADSILSFFNRPASAVLLSASLAAAALGVAIWYRSFRYAPLLDALVGLNRQIASISPRAQASRESAQRIDTLMAGSLEIGREWHVLRTFIRANADGTLGLAGGVRPGDYINMAALDRRGLGRTRFQAMPETFLGAGLILTFCSLVAGLYFAARGIMSPDLSAARASLQLLLNALSFKFMTSIAGLASSLLLGMAYRSATQRIHDELDDLCLSLEERLPALTEPGTVVQWEETPRISSFKRR